MEQNCDAIFFIAFLAAGTVWFIVGFVKNL